MTLATADQEKSSKNVVPIDTFDRSVNFKPNLSYTSKANYEKA